MRRLYILFGGSLNLDIREVAEYLQNPQIALNWVNLKHEYPGNKVVITANIVHTCSLYCPQQGYKSWNTRKLYILFGGGLNLDIREVVEYLRNSKILLKGGNLKIE